MCGSPFPFEFEDEKEVAKDDDASSDYSVEVLHEDRPINVAPAKKEDFKELKVAVSGLMSRVARLEDLVGQASLKIDLSASPKE